MEPSQDQRGRSSMDEEEDQEVRVQSDDSKESLSVTDKFQVRVPSGSSDRSWTQNTADMLQEAVDRIFGASGESLLGLEFSFTIADPFIDGCPLIGCSTGFTKLCGYDLNDIVGHNCRFLIDPVPDTEVDKPMRKNTKEFCEAVKAGEEFVMPDSDREDWMPIGRPADELVAMQRNARKDGSLFNNLFYLKVFDLSNALGEEKPYIVALQSELVGGKETLAELTNNLDQLDEKMAKVKAELAAAFYMQCSMCRQVSPHMVYWPTRLEESREKYHAPAHLYSAFDANDIQPWDEGRFTYVRKLCDATRNKGVVILMQDQTTNELVAVKQMPNQWFCQSHESFIRTYPEEIEMPWQDIGCTKFLNSVDFKYACNLRGVFRNDMFTFVVMDFAQGGDLFDFSQGGLTPGCDREAAVAPLVVEILESLTQLHDMQIVHRDVSLENVLLGKAETDKFDVRLIDFGMASTRRTYRDCISGKASYQAPEMHEKLDYDTLLCDVFAVGVLVYTLVVKDYPWLSTKPGCCKCFEYVRKHGLRAYCEKRKVRGSDRRIADCLSEPLMQLIDGMLVLDPTVRLCLGEKQLADRKSVWDEPWVRMYKLDAPA